MNETKYNCTISDKEVESIKKHLLVAHGCFIITKLAFYYINTYHKEAYDRIIKVVRSNTVECFISKYDELIIDFDAIAYDFNDMERLEEWLNI